MPRPRRPLPGLEHRTLQTYETLWLAIASGLSVLLFFAVIASFVNGTYLALTNHTHAAAQIDGVRAGRIDPQNLPNTPFGTPGLLRREDGGYEAFVVARAFHFEPAVLRLPLNVPVTLHVTSADVMHGLYLERTNVNLNIIPGQVSTTTFTLRHPGDHAVICHEYCGTGHHQMLGRVVVERDPPTLNEARP